MTGRSTPIPGYKMAVSIKLLSISWDMYLNKRVSRLHDEPNTNLRETRQKRNAAHRGNAGTDGHHSSTGTDGEYSDREDCAIFIDGIWYEWLYTQISNMIRGLVRISRSGWIITPKVLIKHKTSHINLHRRHIHNVEQYYALGFV